MLPGIVDFGGPEAGVDLGLLVRGGFGPRVRGPGFGVFGCVVVRGAVSALHAGVRWWRRILRAAHSRVKGAFGVGFADCFATLDPRASAALSQALTGRLAPALPMPAATTERFRGRSPVALASGWLPQGTMEPFERQGPFCVGDTCPEGALQDIATKDSSATGVAGSVQGQALQ